MGGHILVKPKALLWGTTKGGFFRNAKRAISTARVECEERECLETGPLWVPDKRTGIYYPKGHEWVMEGVPKGAANCSRTHWFRSLEGVDKSDDVGATSFGANHNL